MQLFLMCLVVGVFIKSAKTGACKASGIYCINPHQFRICVNLNGRGILTGQPQTCPEGTICDDCGTFACIIGTAPPTTTTPLPPTGPSCFGPAKYPGPSCNQYYECEPIYWWWQSVLKKCPDGQVFLQSVNQCSVSESGDCTSVNTPTAVTEQLPPRVITPACAGPGKYPGPNENQYYECKLVWFNWQLYLETCPDGQTFSNSSMECIKN